MCMYVEDKPKSTVLIATTLDFQWPRCTVPKLPSPMSSPYSSSSKSIRVLSLPTSAILSFSCSTRFPLPVPYVATATSGFVTDVVQCSVAQTVATLIAPFLRWSTSGRTANVYLFEVGQLNETCSGILLVFVKTRSCEYSCPTSACAPPSPKSTEDGSTRQGEFVVRSAPIALMTMPASAAIAPRELEDPAADVDDDDDDDDRLEELRRPPIPKEPVLRQRTKRTIAPEMRAAPTRAPMTPPTIAPVFALHSPVAGSQREQTHGKHSPVPPSENVPDRQAIHAAAPEGA